MRKDLWICEPVEKDITTWLVKKAKFPFTKDELDEIHTILVAPKIIKSEIRMELAIKLEELIEDLYGEA